MRWISCALAFTAAVGMATTAIAAGPIWGATGAGCGCDGVAFQSLSAPPCAAPAFGSMVPGCCECQPSGCDNAWAGYCQEKACKECLWHAAGTYSCFGIYGGHGGYGMMHAQQPMTYQVPHPAAQPVEAPQPIQAAPEVPTQPAAPPIVVPPAPAPMPEPVPESTTSRARRLWPR